MRQLLCALVVLGFFVNTGTSKPAPDDPNQEVDRIEKAKEQVRAELVKLKAPGPGPFGPVIMPFTDGLVLGTYPKYRFISVVFDVNPLLPKLSPPLKTSVIFTAPLEKDGELQLFTDVKELEVFFKSALGKIQDEDKLKDAARTWLLLAATFHQDGHYKLALVDDSVKIIPEKSGKKVTAKVVVTKGGKGEITATLVFDEAGKLVKVDQSADLKPDMSQRPL